jgi:hypothetical protein
MQYYYHPHAEIRMKGRMAPVGVVEADVLAVILAPDKTAPGDFGRINAWGYAANGVRIRVTYDPATGEIRTVAIADGRYKT